MLDDFMIRAALAGGGVAVVAGVLGCFLVWRRMAYFGDATAHAALLGVAISLALNLSIFTGVLLICLIVALMVTSLSERSLGLDSLLGTFAHAALAIGLVAVSLTKGVRADLSAYLFGDILAVSRADLAAIWLGAAVVLVLILSRWQALLTVTLSPELAHASGIAPRRENMLLTLALAISVAVAIKVVGALLIIALMLIPASAARPLARNPEGMAILASLIGVVSVALGLWGSFAYDTPTGPSIVCAAALFFALSALIGRVRMG